MSLYPILQEEVLLLHERGHCLRVHPLRDGLRAEGAGAAGCGEAHLAGAELRSAGTTSSLAAQVRKPA